MASLSFHAQAWFCALFLACGAACGDSTSPPLVQTSAPDASQRADGGRSDDAGERDARSPSVQRDAAPSPSSEEICDGLDNDGNGIIDDRDVGADGVCDCLAIATLGKPATIGPGDVFAGWLDTRSDVGAQPLTDVTADELAKYQVLVIQNLSDRTLTRAEVDALAAWVEQGGGLLTLTGYTAPPLDPNHVNDALAPFGLSYGTQGVLFNLDQLFGGSTIAVTSWTPHPVTEQVTRVGVANGFAVQGDGELLASEAGVNVLMGKQVGKGHVLAWGDEWITINREWETRTDYQVERLWQNMIKWLTADEVCQVPIVLL